MGRVWPNERAVRFGTFEVDLRSGELRKHGLRIKLHQQPFQILQALLEHPGEVISKEALQKRIWPGDTFVDFDQGLYNAIKKLREALGDVADTPRYIETLPKRGYRFIAEIRLDEQLAKPVEGVPSAPEASPVPALQSTPQVVGTSHNYPVVVLTAACCLVLILGLLLVSEVSGFRGRLLKHRNSTVIHSLAVLPLENLSDDPGQRYFAYGMTEELTTKLAQVSGIKVISHTSTALYENNGKPLSQVARELGVDGVVEGAVQRSENKVRITVQLIYTPDDKHLWAETYDRDYQDVLSLESSVAAAIAAQIRNQTGSAKPVSPVTRASPSPQALENYLQGNYSLHRMGAGAGYEGYRAAVTFFKRAISEDPDFALAYVKLAETYDAAFDNRGVALENEAVRKALELDPELADAHVMNGQIKRIYDCDLPGAEREFREAIRLNPNLSAAHDGLACALSEEGRREESIEEGRRAQELDPEGMPWMLPRIFGNRYDLAIERYRKHLEFQPNDGYAYIDGGLIDLYAWKGMRRQSIEALQRGWTLFGFKSIAEGVARAYATSGYEGAYRYSAKQLERLYLNGTVYKPDMIASYYARSGDNEKSLKWLKILSADNNGCMLDVEGSPDFASLRSDPRFQELLKRPR
jgi:TolB-like protein/DNA-binding winged helix-turn-helix (wHTH) protein